MTKDKIYGSVLSAIAKAIERLPNGKAKPADGLTMVVDVREFPKQDWEEIAAKLNRKYADLFDQVGHLGYASIYLVGEDEEHVAVLWKSTWLR